MPKIYERWIVGVSHQIWKLSSQMCSFAEFTDQNWTFAQFTEKHCIGEQTFLLVMELLNNAHHIREMDFRDLPEIWK